MRQTMAQLHLKQFCRPRSLGSGSARARRRWTSGRQRRYCTRERGRTFLKGGIALNLRRLEFRFSILPSLLFVLTPIAAGHSNRQSVTTIDRGIV